MTAVMALLPGDEITILGFRSAVFVAQTEHPLYPPLRLVVWRLEDGSWSHDALDLRQDVGQLTPSTPEDREARLRAALLGPKASHSENGAGA